MFDSVEKLNKFFGNVHKNFATISENEKSTQNALEQILKQEKKEQKYSEKRETKEKRDKQRVKRNKKRKESDTPLMEKLFGKKDLEKKKGTNWLAVILGGGMVLAAGKAVLEETVGDFVSSIPGKMAKGIEDFFKKIIGVITGGTADLKKEAEAAAGTETEEVTGPDSVAPAPKEKSRATEAPVEDLPEESEPAPAPTPEAPEEPETTTAQKTTTVQKTTTNRVEKKTSVTTVVEDETKKLKEEIEENQEEPEEEVAGFGDFVKNMGAYALDTLKSISDSGSAKGSTKTNRRGRRTAAPSAAVKKKTQPVPESGGSISGGMEQKAVVIAKRLMGDLDISAAAASGIVGNLMLESGLIPHNVENGKGFEDGPINNIPVNTRRVGYGYGQWTNDRLEKFRKFLSARGAADRPASDEDNYQYLLHELRGDEPIRNHWKTKTSIPENDPVAAATWFMMNWERPGVPHADRRQDYALQIHKQIKGGSATKLQKGGIAEATKHIKKDEALSSLTRGKNDWIREGGKSVRSGTPWSKVTPQTKLHAYMDSVGQPTIGWGSTYYDNISSGSDPVRMGDVITKKKADDVLHTNVSMLNEKYSREMGTNWKKMSDTQRAGLLSMGYNAPNFYSSKTFAPKLKASLQAGDMKSASANLSWGGPSRTRIAESQKMLLQGPKDLTKVSIPTERKAPVAPPPVKKDNRNFLQKGMDFITSAFGGKKDMPVKKQIGGVIGSAMSSEPVRKQVGGGIGVVPGSGSGDQVPMQLPKGSFVMNREANKEYERLQSGGAVGGATNLTAKASSAINDRFHSANETHTEHFNNKTKRPVIVVQTPAPSSAPIPQGGGKSPASLGGSGSKLNMNEIRNKLFRVSAGSSF